MKEENEQFRELYLLVFALNQPATLQEIYDKSLVGIRRILGVDRASLLMLDENDTMRFQAWINLSAAYRQAVDGHSPWAAREQNPQPLLISDVSENGISAELRPVFEDEGIGALGFFPLLKDFALIGKFMLYYDEPHIFSNEEIQLAEIVAQHIVHAIDRKQSQQSLLQYAKQQNMLAELGQHALNNYFHLPELMTLVLEQTLEMLNADLCELLALETDRKRLRLVAGVGWDEGLVGQATVEAGSGSQAGYTMQQHHPVIVNDFRLETRFEIPELLRSHNVISGMTVIVEGRNQPYGVLGVHTTSPRRFTQEEVNILNVLANILASSIQQKQALTALQSANDLLEDRVAKRTALLHQEITQREMTEEALRQESAYIQLLHRINEISNRIHSLNEGFRLILDEICDFTKWPLAHIYIQASEILENGSEDELVSSDIWHCKISEKFSIFRKITHESTIKRGACWIGEVFESGEPAWFRNDFEQIDPNRIKSLQEVGIDGGLAIPVMVGQEVVAVMEFFTTNFEEPAEELLDVMVQIGNQMGRVVEREQARREVEQNEKNLRNLASRLIRSHEEERSRISHELHDEIGQSLTALKLELDMLTVDETDYQLQEQLVRASKIAKSTLERIQILSYDLRPPEIDTIGLEAALHDLCKNFAIRTNVAVKYKGNNNFPANISGAIKLSLYRALQEGLNNAVKYSNATQIVVKLKYQGHKVTLSVIDNGERVAQAQGTDASEQNIGLLGLIERFARFGGSVNIISEERVGTILKVVVPWKI